MKESTARWFEKAEEDMRAARILLKAKNAPASIVGFLCQQFLEKGLKGFLEENGIKFPKTHDLVQLNEMCEKIDQEFHEIIKDMIPYQAFAVDTRYPSLALDDLTLEKAKSIFKNADRIFKFIHKKIER